MDKSFEQGLQGSRIADKAWNNNKANPHNMHTLKSCVIDWKTRHKVVLNAKEHLQELIKDINATWADALAKEKAASATSDYKQLNEENEKAYTEHVNMVCDEKIAEINRFISKTGDPDLMNLIQGLRTRTEVPDSEWQAIVNRVASSHDYQAMKALQEVANTLDRTFVIPYDADQLISQVESNRKELLGLAKIIGTEDEDIGLWHMHIIGEFSKPTEIQKQFHELDTAVGVTPSAPTVNMIDRLRKAGEVARNNGDNATANMISRFIYEKATYVENRQVIANFYTEEAEALIHKAMENG